MIKTPLSTAIGGAFWTPSCTVIGGNEKPFGDADIQAMFANGKKGFWYDPYDLNTMFQDDTAEIPVAALEQTVGMIMDKSGNNNHATQNTASRKPFVNSSGLSFDGVDDGLFTPNIDLTQSTNLTIIVLSKRLSNTLNQTILASSSLFSTNSGAVLLDSTVSTTTSRLAYSDANLVNRNLVSSVENSRNKNVLTVAKIDLVTKHLSLKEDEAVVSSTISALTSANFGNFVWNIGRRNGSNAFNGYISQMLMINRALTEFETAKLTAYFNKKAGVA